MTRRRFASVPTKILETMLAMRCLRWVHVEARAELLTRQIAADLTAECDATGPWLVSPPPGMH